MSLAQALSTYVTLNILIIIGAASLYLFTFFQAKNYAFILKLHYKAIFAVILLAAFQPFLPRNKIFEPTAKVWSAQSIKSFSSDYDFAKNGGYISIPGSGGKAVIGADRVAWIWVILALFIGAIGGAKMFKDLRALFNIKKSAFLIKKIRNVYIYSHDGICVPFSFWTPNNASVIVPANFLEKPKDLRIAIAHELQHHRQRDTVWIYVLWVLRVACVFNPVIHLWSRRILEIQEFACDEALLGQRKVDSQAYARCLVEVAQSAFHQDRVPACATGLTFLVERNLIKRRIETMLNPSTKRTRKSITITFCAAVAALMVTTTFASKTIVQDRRISLKQAEVMAENARKDSSFPIVVNDLVLAQLNKYVGTPEGRNFMRDSLQRMENYRRLVEGKLQEYNMPVELMAVPIIESGYQNLAENNQLGWGAGLWMFIKSTARNYGLLVNDQVDERLNENLLTDAAMRYLQSNYLRFKDWHLSALSYNIGEGAVQEAIHKTGSRDAWVLIRNGYENDRNYLPKLMAAILIMKNPDSVN